MKHKIGENTSHSYWSWTHGPRWTTHGTSGKRSWWWRTSRRSILHPAGCRDRVFWRSRSRDRGGGETVVKFAIRSASRGFTERGLNIGRRGAPEAGPISQAASRRGQGWGRAHWPPGRGVAPLRLSFGLRESSGTLIFYIFFMEFFGHCKYGYKPAIHRH